MFFHQMSNCKQAFDKESFHAMVDPLQIVRVHNLGLDFNFVLFIEMIITTSIKHKMQSESAIVQK